MIGDKVQIGAFFGQKLVSKFDPQIALGLIHGATQIFQRLDLEGHFLFGIPDCRGKR